MKIYRDSTMERSERTVDRLEEFQQIYADIGAGSAYGYLPIGSAGGVTAILCADVLARESWATPSCAGNGTFATTREDRLEEFQQIYGDIGAGSAYGYLPIGNAGTKSGAFLGDLPQPCKSRVPTGGFAPLPLQEFAGISIPASQPPPPITAAGTGNARILVQINVSVSGGGLFARMKAGLLRRLAV